MKCGFKKCIGIFLVLMLSVCIVACGNSDESEKNAEKDGAKQETSQKAEEADAEEKTAEEPKGKSDEAESSVTDEKEAKDGEKNDKASKNESEKDETVKEDAPQKEETEKESEASEKADNSTESDAPAEPQPADESQSEQTGSAEDAKKVADMVDMLNMAAGSMVAEELNGEGTVQFRADGTRVVIVVSVAAYSSEQIQSKKDKFEEGWAAMTDSYGLVSMIRDTEPAVTAVALEVYGNDGKVALSKAL